MKIGGKVLCIVNFHLQGVPCPKEGNVYTVSDLSDQCGCGCRIRLKEFPIGSLPINGFPCYCTACNKFIAVIHPMGWSKKRFIDLEGDQSLDRDEEQFLMVKGNLESINPDELIHEVLKERKTHERLQQGSSCRPHFAGFPI